MTELWRLSATELANLVRTRKVSAREAAEAVRRARKMERKRIEREGF